MLGIAIACVLACLLAATVLLYERELGRIARFARHRDRTENERIDVGFSTPGISSVAAAVNGALDDLRDERAAMARAGVWAVHCAASNVNICSGTAPVRRLLEEGVPALMDEGEVYLSDAFRNLQAAPPKISVGVSVHGSVLDLEVDTGEFPTAELRELLQSLHQKKRYHRLRDGRLLRLDDNLEGLDELNETLELSGAKLKDGHAELPLYRAPTLDWALSGQNGLRFSRDDAFRRISRSFHAVKDSEYTPPQSLHSVLRKYQRDGYRWLRTLDGYFQEQSPAVLLQVLGIALVAQLAADTCKEAGLSAAAAAIELCGRVLALLQALPLLQSLLGSFAAYLQ